MANYFKDRVVEHPGRVTLTPTGGTNEYDVDRAEGNVSEAGSPINAATLKLIHRIHKADQKFRFGDNRSIRLQSTTYRLNCRCHSNDTTSTSANTAEKVVTCPGFTLTTGAKISVHFSTANRVVGRIKLNVNGTGAIDVLVNDQYSNVGGTCTWDPGQDIMFTYDGANWRSVNGAIINDDELDTLETSLNLSHDGPARLYKILGKIIPKKKTETLTPTQIGTSSMYVLQTTIPLTKPLLAAYPTNRDGWVFIPVAETRVSQTYWCLAASGATPSGSYNMVEIYLDIEVQ